MEKFELKGFNHKVGTYKESAYDNYFLFGINTQKKEWEVYKVKNRVVQEAGILDMNAMVGNVLEISYDRYGQVDYIRIGE